MSQDSNRPKLRLSSGSVGQADWLSKCLERIVGPPGARIAVFGDFCLDAYWLIDSDETETSVETNLPVRRVREQRYGLGGAGNVVANLVDLKTPLVFAITLIGPDMFGQQMLKLLTDRGVNVNGVLQSQDSWQTPVYSKPCMADKELNRIDFGAFNQISSTSIDALAEQLDRTASQADIVILNQQLTTGISTPQMINRINEIIGAHSKCQFIVDSRHRAGTYCGALLKLNAIEAAAVFGTSLDSVQAGHPDTQRRLAQRLYARNGKPVFLTRGQYGLIAAGPEGVNEIPGIEILQRTDPVGAGDTTVATLAASLATGSNFGEAAVLANIAASVTVRKFQTTGTVTPQEIKAIGPDPDYIYQPHKADQLSEAQYLAGTQIEVLRRPHAKLQIQHAIFDHDGTISTLREGWEQIMEPFMEQAILGPLYENADRSLVLQVRKDVRQYIDRTTGIQTLTQMNGLVELVRQYGCVPQNQIKDMHGYKAVYNRALLDLVDKRRRSFESGEVKHQDLMIENVQALLEYLYEHGVKLYLASGTDEADVKHEAQIMGYADLFEGGIFGAVGDINIEAKRMVMDRIIAKHNLHGAQFVTFGDGPVEIRETRKRNGVAVGVASDEVKRQGLNPSKRSRLIRAGADLILADFRDLDRLLEFLQLV